MKQTAFTLASLFLFAVSACAPLDAQETQTDVPVTGTETTTENSSGEEDVRLQRKADAEALVKRMIKEFHHGIRSKTPQDRQEALKTMTPTEEQLAKLFGQAISKNCFEALRPEQEKMLDSVDEIASQVARDGEFLSVELQERKIPERVEEKAFKTLFQNVPEHAMRFDAEIRTTKASSSSKSYFVINGDVLFLNFGQLMKMARHLNR